MNNMVLRRIGAYIIDMIIIFIAISIVGLFMPRDSKLEKDLTNQINDLFNMKDVSNEDLEEIKSTTYELAKSGIALSIITVAIYYLYFAVLPVYNNGKTLGKMVTKIKIKSSISDELLLWQTSIRGMFISQYLFEAVDLILIVMLSKKEYFNISTPLSNVQTILFVVCFLSIIFNKGTGIHDYFGKTVVILDEDDDREDTRADEWKEKNKKVGINSDRVKNHTKRKGE